ncbi:hypothetical protein D9601_02330 [Sphingomonas sp. MA1305]|nr:hypothetical protein [Sphingomonas sp. MA1305]
MDKTERVGLFQALGAYLDARRQRKAWNLVARGLALHPPIASDIVRMALKHTAAIRSMEVE